MEKHIVSMLGDRHVILMDSISYVSAEDAGHIIVSGSHGGSSSAAYAVQYALFAVFFNDAGIGKEQAGIAALPVLDQLAVPAGTVSHMSARIGDAYDTWAHGALSCLNDTARQYGLIEGQLLREAVQHLLQH